MIRIGVLGGAAAEVDEAGGVHLADGTVVRWLVGAADRWHDPADEPTRRTQRLLDMPVVETAVRVPGGDARHRAYAVADHGGLLVVEVENASSEPFAVAFVAAPAGVPMVAARPPSTVAVEGVTLPPGASVWPVAHRTVQRVVLPLDGGSSGSGRAWAWPGSVPGAEQVARGWLAQSERVLRAELGDDVRQRRLRAARADVLLAGDDPAARLVAGARDADAVARDVWELTAPLRGRRPPAPAADVPWALACAAATLRDLGEARAAGDVEQLLDRLARTGPPAPPGDRPTEVVAGLRAELLDDRGPGVAFLPGPGLVRPGQSVEAHDVPTRHGRVGVALRWHGARPALLWECERPVRLTAPGLDARWHDERPRGEALLAPVVLDAGPSFS